MLTKFLLLEWQSFYRSASFRTGMFIKILMILGVLYFMAVFTVLGTFIYYILEKKGFKPLNTVNGILVFYLIIDFIVRFFLQKIPVMNIRPLLYLNIKKNTIVRYTLGKSALSMFNWLHLFLLLPFTIVLIVEEHSAAGAVAWFVAVFALILVNNFVNILSSNKQWLLYFPGAVLVAVGVLEYFDLFNITEYIRPLFNALYTSPVLVLVPLLMLLAIITITFRFFRKNLYLDAGLSVKQSEAETEDYSWLTRYGTLGTFLKNDIRLIKRNKRSRTTIIMSTLFLFYGLLFFTGGVEAYDAPVWKIFAGIFVTGGFLFTFGQFVPSWDSSYYPLMMSQNIQYREYLNSKWWLMIIATLASTILSTFYLYFGWEAYLAVLVGAVYNMGVNAHLVLWGGAYIRTPIDLTQSKNVLGNKQAFNSKTLLLSLPKLVLPLILYALGHYLFDPRAGYIMVVAVGVLGFAFKNKVFGIIENIYKTEKYKTIAAYKQSN